MGRSCPRQHAVGPAPAVAAPDSEGRRPEVIRSAVRAVGARRGADPDADAALDAVVRDHSGLAISQLRRFKCPPPGNTWEDLHNSVRIGILDALRRYRPADGEDTFAATVVAAVRSIVSDEIVHRGWPVKVPRYAFAARSRAARGLPYRPHDAAAVDRALAAPGDYGVAADSAIDPRDDPTESVDESDILERSLADVEAELRSWPRSGLRRHEASAWRRDAEAFARRHGLLGHEPAAAADVARAMGIKLWKAEVAIRRASSRLRAALARDPGRGDTPPGTGGVRRSRVYAPKRGAAHARRREDRPL